MSHHVNIVIVEAPEEAFCPDASKADREFAIRDAAAEYMQSGADDWWDYWDVGGKLFGGPDFMPVADLTAEHLNACDRVICPDGVYHKQRYLPWLRKFEELAMPPLEWLISAYTADPDDNYIAVVVDNHV